MITRRHPGLVPDGLVKGVIGFVVAVQAAQAQAEVVERRAVGRIGIAAGEAGDGVAEERFGEGEFAAPEMPEAEGVVATPVLGSRRRASCQYKTGERVA